MFSRSSVFSTIESYSRVKRKTINNRSALNEYPSRTISILFMLEEYYDLFFFSFHLSLWQSILSYWRERRSDARRQQKKNDELFLLFTVPYASISLLFTLALVRSVPFASLSLSTSHCRFFQIVLRSFAYRAYAHLTSNALSNGK